MRRPGLLSGSMRFAPPIATSRPTTRSGCSASRTTSERVVTAAFAWVQGGTGRLALERERGLVKTLTVVFD